MQKETIKPTVSEAFEPGTILVATWGYEQTNVDFYCILQRSGEWVTIIEMKQIEASDTLPGNAPSMTGKVLPTEIDWRSRPFRKKVKSFNGKESGFRLSNGWATLWNGKPKFASHYA